MVTSKFSAKKISKPPFLPPHATSAFPFTCSISEIILTEFDSSNSAIMSRFIAFNGLLPICCMVWGSMLKHRLPGLGLPSGCGLGFDAEASNAGFGFSIRPLPSHFPTHFSYFFCNPSKPLLYQLYPFLRSSPISAIDDFFTPSRSQKNGFPVSKS
jgi:hypothetical protein